MERVRVLQQADRAADDGPPARHVLTCLQQKAYRRRRVAWPPQLEEAEDRAVLVVASGEAEPWRAIEQLALAWRAAADMKVAA